MDNIKRPRMEATATTTPLLNGGVGATTTTATIGGQSIFLSNASANDTLGVLPANVFLTICDDNSDDSDEYLTIDGSTLARIKQEQDIGTQTQALPLQYRIINQLQRQPLSPTESSTTTTASLSSLNSQTLPASLQLPSGCEIYLVKEYIESPATTISTSSGNNELFAQTPVSAAATTTTTIKVEPDSPIAARTRTGTVAATSGEVGGVSNVQIMRGNIPCLVTAKKTPTIATATAQTATVEGNNGKRSFILEAYKKRDDKRRATHNEVERRRRDKINSWIFKLKEMLPTDIPNNNIIMTTTTTNTVTNTNNNCTAAVTSTSSSSLSSEQLQQQRNNNINNSRTPPSDSKSQILIKACDYIKAMQDEIKSLRECLTENENLRLSNQRLQNELNKIRNERSNCNNLVNGNSNNNNSNNNPNSTYNITLNSLNSNGLFGAGAATVIGNVNNGATASYTKRELIITDYVD